MKRAFVVSSLVAAGIGSDDVTAKALPDAGIMDKPSKNLFDLFRMDHKYDLSAHRSHSSHRSHRSHRSSSGGGYSSPSTPDGSRNRQSTPPSSVLPSPPAAAPSTLPGNTEKFKEIVRQVQTALYAYGYYTGAIDGIVGPQTRAAISKMQKDYGLKVTGTVTPEVLDALRISAQ